MVETTFELQTTSQPHHSGKLAAPKIEIWAARWPPPHGDIQDELCLLQMDSDGFRAAGGAANRVNSDFGEDGGDALGYEIIGT